MSPYLAASTSIEFSGAEISRPSIVKVTNLSSGRGMSGHQSEPVALARGLDVRLELGPEVLDHRADRHRHRVAEHAQAVADDLLADGRHDVEVHRRRLAGVDALEHLHRPVGSLAAGRALPARLVAIELRGLERDVDDRDGVVDDDDRAGPEHRPGLRHRLEVVGQVEVLVGPRQHRRARAARIPELDRAPVLGTAGEAVDDVARRDPELDLVVARSLDASRDRDDLGAGRALGPDLGVLGAAHPQDDRGGHQRLDVVDQRRALVEALDGGERRLQARITALALERVEQRGLLAADVRASAAVHPQDEVPEQVGGLDLLERALQDRGLQVVLAPDEDERPVCLDRARGDRDALDQQMRVLLHQLAVLERARLGLVGVADDVLVELPLGQERRLRAHREAGTAAAAQTGGLQLGEHVGGLHVERPGEHLVAAALAPVDVERVQPGLVDVVEEEMSQRLASGSTERRRRSCLSSSTGPPALTSATMRAQSDSSSGPTYSPLTDAIGAMSHAPRHSNDLTWKSGSLPAASSIAA